MSNLLSSMLEQVIDECDTICDVMEEKFQDTLKNFEVFASSHELTKPTKRSRIFLSPRKVSPLLVPIFKSTESCATPNNKTQSKSKVDSQKTICQITTEVNSKQALHPRRVRRIKRDFDGTPMAGRLRKDTESQSTPVAASNFAAKPKNIMDVAEEDPATLNDSLIDCEFLVPSNFPTKQRRINFDDIDTNDESDDEREALFGSVFKFPSWTQSHKLHASIKRQSYVDRRVVDALFSLKPVNFRNPWQVFPKLDTDQRRRSDSCWEK